MQTELRETARRVCKAEEIMGAVRLINHQGKACFIQGLHNDRIQTIVRSRGESILLTQTIEISLEEEGAILSVREKSGATVPLLRCHKCSKLGHTANKCRCSEKIPHTRVREVNVLLRLLMLRVALIVDVMVTSQRIADRDRCVESVALEAGHTEINCRVQGKGWTKSSGNESRELVCNPRTAQAKKQ